ncbi:MAG: 3-phosphoshikimate 1-carboxyvinyltransferase [Salibacteraceae bacterium]
MNEIKFNIKKALLPIITPVLPANKSIVNRLMILASLSQTKLDLSIANMPNDVFVLYQILDSGFNRLNVEDAGTAARFTLSWACIQNQTLELFGTERMHQRPMGPLINALRSIGFSIECLKNEGFLPVRIIPNNLRKSSDITIDSNISSQFISSLCLIAPFLEDGLNIKLTGNKASWPYVEMTLNLLKSAGAIIKTRTDTIQLKKAHSLIPSLKIESDWSAAAFWYQISSILPNQKFIIQGLSADSIQGDKETISLFKQLGVCTIFKKGQIEFQKVQPPKSKLKIDFTNFPDLAQPFISACVLNGVDGEFLGLKTLRFKETDRINALKTELEKTGAKLAIKSDKIHLTSPKSIPDILSFSTHLDHRMAMALAPFALVSESVKMDNPEVVKKSYPQFWQELEKVGVTLHS